MSHLDRVCSAHIATRFSCKFCEPVHTRNLDRAYAVHTWAVSRLVKAQSSTLCDTYRNRICWQIYTCTMYQVPPKDLTKLITNLNLKIERYNPNKTDHIHSNIACADPGGSLPRKIKSSISVHKK